MQFKQLIKLKTAIVQGLKRSQEEEGWGHRVNDLDGVNTVNSPSLAVIVLYTHVLFVMYACSSVQIPLDAVFMFRA